MKKIRLTTRELVLCALFAALVAVGAFIKIPIGLVSITLQVLFSVLAGLLLGSRLGAAAVFTYILIGLAGIPVFTQGGGIGYVFQPTFGYLIGFGVGAYMAGLIVEKSKSKTFITYLTGAFALIVSVYVIGLPYLYVILNYYLGKNVGAGTALVSYCLVFLPNDILSCVLAAFAAKRLKPVLMIGNM